VVGTAIGVLVVIMTTEALLVVEVAAAPSVYPYQLSVVVAEEPSYGFTGVPCSSELAQSGSSGNVVYPKPIQ